MSHCYTVANSYCGKHDWVSACHGYACFYSLYYFVDIHVSRDNLVVGAYDTDHRLAYLLVSHSQCVQQ